MNPTKDDEEKSPDLTEDFSFRFATFEMTIKNIMTDHQNNNKPPLIPSWKAWYILVVIILIVLIAFFYYLTKKYS